MWHCLCFLNQNLKRYICYFFTTCQDTRFNDLIYWTKNPALASHYHTFKSLHMFWRVNVPGLINYLHFFAKRIEQSSYVKCYYCKMTSPLTLKLYNFTLYKVLQDEVNLVISLHIPHTLACCLYLCVKHLFVCLCVFLHLCKRQWVWMRRLVRLTELPLDTNMSLFA